MARPQSDGAFCFLRFIAKVYLTKAGEKPTLLIAAASHTPDRIYPRVA